MGVVLRLRRLPTRSLLWGLPRASWRSLSTPESFIALVVLVFQGTAIWYVMRYAKRSRSTRSNRDVRRAHGIYPTGCERLRRRLYPRQKLCLLLFLVTIGMLLFGTIRLGWYINEIWRCF